jgi:capsid protein
MEIDFLNPVYEMWLAEELAAGRVRAPGWNDPRLRAAWLHNHWWGAPLPIIDPVKAMRADRGYAEMGAHHLDEVTRNLNGGNGEINRAKLAKQYDELAIAPWTKKQEG